jgi:hypothetical protein
LDVLALKEIDEPTHERRGDRSATTHDDAQGREVSSIDSGFSSHHVEHGRHEVGDGDALVLDQVKRRICFKSWQKHVSEAAQRASNRSPCIRKVKHGRDVSPGVLLPHRQSSHCPLRMKHHVSVREHDTLGLSRRATGEVQMGDRAGINRANLSCACGEIEWTNTLPFTMGP